MERSGFVTGWREIPRAERRVASPARYPWSSQRWCDYFGRQRQALLAIPWERGAELTPAERDMLIPSLQVFQQGEAQEGGHFYRYARTHAEETGDIEFIEAHRLFMQEEQRHGRDLGRFLTLADIPLLGENSRMTRAFCWLGSRGGIELTLLIILMSEIIALVYYAALRRATSSAVLRRLCAQILRDERQHVRFQSERLAILRRQRFAVLLLLNNILDRLLFLGAVTVCWLGHRGVLCAGGLEPRSFWAAAWRTYSSCARRKHPRHYD